MACLLSIYVFVGWHVACLLSIYVVAGMWPAYLVYMLAGMWPAYLVYMCWLACGQPT